ncbi:MAG TPA: IS200/IS605 family transposase [Longimicrobium sp.]|nr:IS200/IS605 family transposase [Longimicrobium sp.]
MRSPYTQLYLHLVWSTWDRYPHLADLDLRQRVYECINAECTRRRADVLAIGGIEDHVHVLVRPPATVAPADLVKHMKGASSHMVNYHIGRPDYFKWQGGYGAFSVSKRHVPMIHDYVLRQEEHHREQRLFEPLEPPPPGAREKPGHSSG